MAPPKTVSPGWAPARRIRSREPNRTVDARRYGSRPARPGRDPAASLTAVLWPRSWSQAANRARPGPSTEMRRLGPDRPVPLARGCSGTRPGTGLPQRSSVSRRRRGRPGGVCRAPARTSIPSRPITMPWRSNLVATRPVQFGGVTQPLSAIPARAANASPATTLCEVYARVAREYGVPTFMRSRDTGQPCHLPLWPWRAPSPAQMKNSWNFSRSPPAEALPPDTGCCGP